MNAIEAIARVAHEANRAYCATLGDDSQLTWDDAPGWQRESAIAGVGAHLENDLSPADSHRAWLAHKAADGWTWGPIKDPEAKQHPCMVEYDQLPEDQQRKDALFSAVVAALRA